MNHPHKSTTNKEWFFHFRQPFTYRGKAMRGCTAFLREESQKIFISVAMCSARDNWCKSRGRTVARRKWFDENARATFYFGPVECGALGEAIDPAFEKVKAYVFSDKDINQNLN